MSNKFNTCKLVLSVLLTLESRMQISVVLSEWRVNIVMANEAPASRTNITITNIVPINATTAGC